MAKNGNDKRTPVRANQVSSNSDSKSSSTVLYAVIGIVVALFVGLLFRNSLQTVQNLRGADMATVKAALLGPTPFVLYCHRGGVKEEPPANFVALHAEFRAKIGFAMVNCHSKLTESATVYERFKLDKKVKPTIFITSPWGRAIQVPLSAQKELTTFRKFLKEAITPHGRPVTSEKQLFRDCNFNVSTPVGDLPPCVVVVKGGKYGDKHAALEEQLVTHYRSLRVVSLDAMKHRLSFEDAKKNPADHFGMKVYAMKGMRRHMTMIYPLDWSAIKSFVDNAIKQPLSGYDSTSDKSTVTVVKAKASKKFKDRNVQPPLGTGPGAGAGGGGGGGAGDDADIDIDAADLRRDKEALEADRGKGKGKGRGEEKGQGQSKDQGQGQGQGQGGPERVSPWAKDGDEDEDGGEDGKGGAGAGASGQGQRERQRVRERRAREAMEEEERSALFEEEEEGEGEEEEDEEDDEDEDVIEL